MPFSLRIKRLCLVLCKKKKKKEIAFVIRLWLVSCFGPLKRDDFTMDINITLKVCTVSAAGWANQNHFFRCIKCL